MFGNGGLAEPKFIINILTKRHWRDPSRMADIEAGLVDLVAHVQRLYIRSIAIPPLGCGNGGLNWADLRPKSKRHSAVFGTWRCGCLPRPRSTGSEQVDRLRTHGGRCGCREQIFSKCSWNPFMASAPLVLNVGDIEGKAPR